MIRSILVLTLICAFSAVGGGLVMALGEPKDARFEIPEKDICEPGESGKAAIVSDKANLLSLELTGTWTIDLEVFGRLHPGGRGFPQKFEVTFSDNAEQAKRIVANIESAMPALEGDMRGNRFAADFREAVRRIYKAGELVMIEGDETMTMAYALIVWRGNPHLLLLEKENDFESAHVMLARDSKGDADILFMGGDRTDESMVPLKRKK